MRSRWSVPASFMGRYHVLGGAISLIDGIDRDLKIRELCLRLADGTVTEVILARPIRILRARRSPPI